nr:DUF882 domain-containing protein [Desulfobulbus alkaliphilus]
MTRRFFLQQTTRILAGITVASIPVISNASSVPVLRSTRSVGKRSLSFYHIHTQQSLDVTYAWGTAYNAAALERINYFLRDFRSGEVYPIDPKLLDILWTIQEDMGRNGVYEVISAFRSPATNGQLRQGGAGVADRSLHMQGKAIDVRFTGARTNQIQQRAIQLQRGGVGYYARSDFVHLDTGRYRVW